MYQTVYGRVYVYLTHTRVIHNTYTLFAYFPRNSQFVTHFVNLQGVTTRVCVVYMFNKHIHALNLLIVSIITNVFRGRVYVWRLILKKNLLNTEMHLTVPGAFKKIPDDDQKIYSKKLYF